MDGIQNLEIYNGNNQTVNSKGSSLFKTPSDLWYITMNYALKVDSLGSSLKFIGDIGKIIPNLLMMYTQNIPQILL